MEKKVTELQKEIEKLEQLDTKKAIQSFDSSLDLLQAKLVNISEKGVEEARTKHIDCKFKMYVKRASNNNYDFFEISKICLAFCNGKVSVLYSPKCKWVDDPAFLESKNGRLEDIEEIYTLNFLELKALFMELIEKIKKSINTKNKELSEFISFFEKVKTL